MEPASRCFKIFNCHVALRDATLLRPLNKTRSTLSLSWAVPPFPVPQHQRHTQIGRARSSSM